MKTIEEKAKAYDEALERAKHVKLTNTKENVAAAEYIFPELHESEDEKVRKEMLEFVSSADISEILDEETQARWYNYLQRQKEQKPVEWSEEDKLTVDAAIYWLERKLRMKKANDITSDTSPLSMRTTAERLKSLRPSWKPDCDGCAKHLEGYINGRTDAENKLLEKYGIVETPEDELHMKPRWKPSEEQIYTLERISSNLHLRASDDAPKLDEIIELLKRK